MVRFDTSYISNVNPDAPSNNGEFSFNLNSAALVGLRVDDMSPDIKGLNARIKKGMKLNFVQGPMWFSFSNFKMIPRGFNDIDLSHLDSLPPVIAVLGNNPDTITKGSTYTDAGATAIDNIDGNITGSIMKTGTVDANTIGTYTIWYKATDAWGNSDSAHRTVVVKDSSHVGINENEMNFAQLNLYPNPASSVLNIDAKYIQSGNVNVTILDVFGKEIMSKNYNHKQFNDNLNIENLTTGVYFCVFKNDRGIRTLKFVVNK